MARVTLRWVRWVAAQHVIVGGRIAGRPRLHGRALVRQQPAHDARGDLARHRLLDREQVGPRLLELLAPHLDPPGGPHQLRAHLQPGARAPEAAGHQVGHVQRPRDRCQIREIGAPVPPYGVVALDGQPLDGAEPARDRFRQAISEIGVVRIAGNVVEVQHGDRVRPWWCRAGAPHGARRRRAVGTLRLRGAGCADGKEEDEPRGPATGHERTKAQAGRRQNPTRPAGDRRRAVRHGSVPGVRSSASSRRNRGSVRRGSRSGSPR